MGTAETDGYENDTQIVLTLLFVAWPSIALRLGLMILCLSARSYVKRTAKSSTTLRVLCWA
jgi:hypothetical protein